MTGRPFGGPPTRRSPPRFGEVAVELGYITPGQLKEALVEQAADETSGRPHRLIGSILCDRGWLTLGQREIILDRIVATLSLSEGERSSG